MKTSALEFHQSKSGVFARCVGDALGILRDLRAWIFLLPQALVSGALLAGLIHFHLSPGNLLWVPIVRAIAGEDALHYPRFFRELPLVFSVLEAFAAWAVFSIGWAAFVRALPRLFSESPLDLRRSAGAALRRAPRIWGGLLPAFAIQIVALILVEQLRTSDIAESPRRFQFAQLASFGVISLVQILTAYVIPAIMLGDLSLREAWARSWSLSTRSFWTTTAFVILPRLPEIPIRFVLANLPALSDRLDPDTAGPLLGARVLASMAGVLLTAAATSRLYLHLYGEKRS